ncbi:Ankyrin repeat-containing domain protein, partial [Elaphomyces granulatus]
IRMEDAEASSDVDRNRIHADVQNSIGFLEFNASVRAALLSASIDPPEAEIVLPLLCDSDDQLLRQRAAMHNDKARLLATLAAAGLEQAVAVLIEEFGYDYEDTSMPALWRACCNGRLRVARMLVDRYHASVEGRAGNGVTPLAAAAAMMAAATQGNTHILAILRQAGAYADHVDDDGKTALTHAINGLHTDAASLQPDPKRFSPLHWAAFRGSRDIAKLLIDNGGNIEARAADGTPPLVTAAVNGHPDVVALLIHAGADVGAANDSGWGVVDCAVKGGHLEVLEVIAAEVPPTKLHLLRNPAIRALRMAMEKQNSAIPFVPVIDATYHIADDQSESISILANLISAGADVTVRDAGASVLFFCKSLRALQVLTSRPGAIAALQTLINERLADGSSALHFAAAGNRAEVVRGLAGILGAKIDLAGPFGATPLAQAVLHDAVASARVLLEEGADIHIKTPDGRTLLKLARDLAGDEMVALIKAHTTAGRRQSCSTSTSVANSNLLQIRLRRLPLAKLVGC